MNQKLLRAGYINDFGLIRRRAEAPSVAACPPDIQGMLRPHPKIAVIGNNNPSDSAGYRVGMIMRILAAVTACRQFS